MIATNIEQSRRLLDAGLDPGSADMMWRNVALTYDFGHAMEVPTVAPILYAFNAKSKDSIPAWSLSALWKIASERGITADFNTKEESPDQVMEILMDLLTDPLIKIMDAVVEDRI